MSDKSNTPSDAPENTNSAGTAKMPLRDARSGKPGSSGASTEQHGWSDEARRAGTGEDKEKSSTGKDGGEPSGQTAEAGNKDQAGEL